MNATRDGIKRATLIGCLVVSSAFMILGHAKIMASGKSHCGRQVSNYELCHHYVSDYAKHPEHGWMIKTSIGLFCVCIALVLGDYGAAMAAGGHFHRFVWLMFLGGAMIGGLTMVALYDARSMTWYADIQDGIFKVYQAVGFPEWEFVRKLLGRPDVTKDGLHDMGFGVFAIGFLLLVVTAAWIKQSDGQGLATKTLTFLVVAALLFVWASCFDDYLPGIPQRTLLAAIAGWLVLSHIRYSRPATIRDT